MDEHGSGKSEKPTIIFDISEQTHFMNVDLDVISRSPLDPLAVAFGKAVRVLYVGREGRFYGAHFEVTGSFDRTADVAIRRFVALVKKLPPRGRTLWNRARSRDFNIGIQAEHAPYAHELRLRCETVEAVSRIGGSIVVTTYAPVETASARAETPPRQSRRT